MKQFLSFAIGREPTEYEQDLVDEMVEAFRLGNHDFKTFIIDYIASERFARRGEEGA